MRLAPTSAILSSGPARVSVAVLWALMIFALSSVPRSTDRDKTWPEIPHADKAVHFGLYAGLGFLVRHAGRDRWKKQGLAWSAVAVVIASIYGVSDELHQTWVPGRTPSVFDWVFDTLGASFGAFTAEWSARKNRLAERSIVSCDSSDTA